ncbi:MAG: kelch repeat-containing protein, partial [Deltaproteobacteria bacterium]
MPENYGYMRSYFVKAIICFLLLFLPLYLYAEVAIWETKKPALKERSEVAAASIEGKIYVIGGFGRFGVTDLLEEYDTSTDTWKEKAPLPTPLHHIGAAEAGGKIYVIGGFKRLWPWSPMDTVYEYDPAKDQWTQKASMPTARGALALGVVNNKIYA